MFSSFSYYSARTVQVAPMRTRPFPWSCCAGRQSRPRSSSPTLPMMRAFWSFHAVGYPVIASALHVGKLISLSASAFFPQVPALLDSYYELFGMERFIYRYGDYCGSSQKSSQRRMPCRLLYGILIGTAVPRPPKRRHRRSDRSSGPRCNDGSHGSSLRLPTAARMCWPRGSPLPPSIRAMQA
jgi:hypothetical protein